MGRRVRGSPFSSHCTHLSVLSPCSRPLTSWPHFRALSFQSSTQEIGEELINGVIYSISLRKVQLHQGATKGQRWLGVSMKRGPELWADLSSTFPSSSPKSSPCTKALLTYPLTSEGSHR